MGTKSLIFALITALLWGLAPVLAKAGLRGQLSPLAALVVRSFGILVCTSVVLLLSGHVLEPFQSGLKNLLLIIAAGLLSGGLAHWTYYVALKAGEASQVVPIAATYPLVALLFALLFLGEPFTWQKGIGIGLIVVGVVLIR